MRRLQRTIRLVISMVCILVMIASMIAPFFTVAKAETEAAHTVNIFDVGFRNGAEYYTEYVLDDPAPGVQNLHDAWVWKADKSDEGHKFIFNVKFSLSGEGASDKPDGMSEEDYQAAQDALSEKFIQIRIPEHILKDSNGNWADEVEMPVPDISQIDYKEVTVGGVTKKVYATSHYFAYEYDEKAKEYIIYNIQPVSSGVVYEFPVAYRTTKNTWDYTELEPSEPFRAHLDVASWEKEKSPEDNPVPLEYDSGSIPVYIDTQATIKKTEKKAEHVLVSAEKAENLTGLTGLDPNCRYVIWSVMSEISGVTQKYNLTLNDVFDGTYGPITGTDAGDVDHTVNGEVVAVKVGSSYKYTDEEDFNTITGLTASGRRTDYVLVAYPYEPVMDGETVVEEGVRNIDEAPMDAVYTAKNNASVTLTPADGKDAQTVTSGTASFKYERKEPNWSGVEEKYTVNKFGLYNHGKSRVSGKNNVSSYELENLTTDKNNEVDELQYEINVSAHAYGKTIASLNDEIKTMTVEQKPDENGNAVILLGNREYRFNTDASDPENYTYEVWVRATDENGNFIDDGNGGWEYASNYSVTENLNDIPSYDGSGEIDVVTMKRIAALNIEEEYYGKSALYYNFDEKTFELISVSKPAAWEDVPLDENDYKIDSVDFKYLIKGYVYDRDEMQYTAGEAGAYDYDHDEYNTIDVYVYNNGSNEAVLAGSVNMATGEVSNINSLLIKSLTTDNVTFADEANVTGYSFRTHNKYFYIEMKLYPSITLKPSAKIKEKVDPLFADSSNSVERKIGVRNTIDWTVSHESGTSLYNRSVSATDYVAGIVRDSSISKKALGERVSFKGQDGNTYRSENDTMLSQYRLGWQIKASETADGVEVNGVISTGVPVAQQSGIFYDLLPAHCDIIEGSVNVYADLSGDVTEDSKALSPSEFEVLERIDDYNGSGKKLLVIKINAPCAKNYYITYITVHTHEDIQDYGSIALNTVAYQTGNSDIGGGYPDNGGNYAVSMSDYIKDLDPDNNGAKRFIYAESTEDILALFPTSSGIYKKVATSGNPTFSRTGTVHNGESYTYNIRMQNDSSTKARDIAILDSVENYRTVDGYQYNYGVSRDRDWAGTIEAFELGGVEAKIIEYIGKVVSGGGTTQTQVSDLKLILYTGDEIIDFNDSYYSNKNQRRYILSCLLENGSKVNEAINGMLREEAAEQSDYPKTGTAAEKQDYEDAYIAANFAAKKAELESTYADLLSDWVVADDWRNPTNVDLSKVSAFIVYTGEHFVLQNNESLSFNVRMRAPDHVEHGESEDGVVARPQTYNNVYRSFTTFPETASDTDTNVTYFYTHYDYTQLSFSTVGTLKFSKVDSVTGEGVPGVEFSLTGVSDYGTSYNETLYSDDTGYVFFKNLERGTYTLIESASDEDHVLNPAPRTVTVDPQGDVTIVTVDGEVIDNDGSYLVLNQPRYHGTFEFYKRDALNKKGVSGAKFRLTGISDHNTAYDLIAESGADGLVSFGDIEKGTYTLEEIGTPSGYLPPGNSTYTVTSSGDDIIIFAISGENAGNDGSDNYILNMPTAEMKLQKTDSITGKTLDDAEFTLRASNEVSVEAVNSLNNLYTKLTAENPDMSEDKIYALMGWSRDGSDWVQTVEGANTGISGIYAFESMPEGTYTLTEDNLPHGYDTEVAEYTLSVELSTDKESLIVTFADESVISYIKLENGEFAPATAQDAEYIRLFNDETYEDDKIVIKSWVGDVDGSFPSMYLSTEKPEEEASKATIDKNILRTMLESDSSNVTSFKKSESTPPANATDAKNYSLSDENVEVKIWKDGTTVYWWSSAYTTYMPTDCSGLFQNCKKLTSVSFNDLDFSRTTNMENMFNGCSTATTLDLTAIETSKVTTMEGMFKGCKALTTINLDYTKFTAADKLTTVKEMFSGCENLAGIDLRGFGNCVNLESIENWFYNCKRLTYIDLSNFSTTDTLSNIKGIFYYSGQALSGSPGTNTGTKVFAKTAWAFSDDSDFNFDAVNYFRINLYGIMYKNKAEDSNNGNPTFDLDCAKAHFKPEYQNPPPTNGQTGNNLRTTGGYFNPAYVEGTTEYNSSNYSDFYRQFCISTYGGIDSVSGQSGDSSATTPTIDADSFSFDDYTNFHKVDSVIQTENSSATAEDVGKTSFKIEYKTKNATVPVDGAEPYEVDETITLTVSKIVQDGDTFYTVSQEYEYDEVVKALWTSVDTTAPAQWICTMKVNNSDDDFYFWEDIVDGYTSTHDADHPALVKGGDTNAPVVTNATEGTKLGSLSLKKTLEGTDSEKFSRDEFWFKVTMRNEDGSLYTSLPFGNGENGTEAGVAYFKLRPNVEDEELTVITGIPEGCTYVVEEVSDPNDTVHVNPAGYTVSNQIDTTGTITEATPKTAEIVNSIDTVNLSLEKQGVVKRLSDGVLTPITDTSDSDYAGWMNQSFAYTVSFTNLVMGEEYSYSINGVVQTDKIVAETTSEVTTKVIVLKPGDKAVFIGLPVGTTYSVSETTRHSDTTIEEHLVSYEVTGDNNVEAEGEYVVSGLVLGENGDEIVYTNTKNIKRMELVDLKIEKQWKNENGSIVSFTFDSLESQNVVTLPGGNYPSFLKVVIGRALVYETNGETIYMDVVSSYMTESINVKNNLKAVLRENPGVNPVIDTWSAEFKGLDKFAEITLPNGQKQICRYVYFVSELVPLGFENVNTQTKEEIGDGEFFVVEDDPDSPGNYKFLLENQEEPTHTLSITKLVDGNMADMTKEFTFEVSFTKDGKPLTGTGLTMQFTDMVDSSYLRKRTYTIEGGKVSVSLPYGKVVSFLALPEGVNYTITEDPVQSGSYTVVSGQIATDPFDPLNEDTTGFAETRVQSGKLSADAAYLYVNTCDGELPTGISLSHWPVYMLLIIMIAILSLMLVKRLREVGDY